MGGTVYVGLAVTSHVDATLCTATFSDISVVAPPAIVSPAAATPNPVTGATTSLSVAASDHGGEASLTYTWSATSVPPGANAPTFSRNGTNAAKTTTAIFSSPGDYQFRVTVQDGDGMTTTSDVLVTVNSTLTSVVVLPSSTSVAPGTSIQFSAVARDQFGVALSPQPVFEWTATVGTITASGLYTAPGEPTTATMFLSFN